MSSSVQTCQHLNQHKRGSFSVPLFQHHTNTFTVWSSSDLWHPLSNFFYTIICHIIWKMVLQCFCISILLPPVIIILYSCYCVVEDCFDYAIKAARSSTSGPLKSTSHHHFHHHPSQSPTISTSTNHVIASAAYLRMRAFRPSSNKDMTLPTTIGHNKQHNSKTTTLSSRYQLAYVQRDIPRPITKTGSDSAREICETWSCTAIEPLITNNLAHSNNERACHLHHGEHNILKHHQHQTQDTTSWNIIWS